MLTSSDMPMYSDFLTADIPTYSDSTSDMPTYSDFLTADMPRYSDSTSDMPTYSDFLTADMPTYSDSTSDMPTYSDFLTADMPTYSPIPHSRHVELAQATYSLYYIQFVVLHKYFILKFHCLSSSSIHKSYIK